MVRDPFADEEEPPLQAVLDALDDETCRELLRAMEEPMTASELSDASDVPLSTTYRKLEALSEASLVDELTEIRSDGQHTTRYEIDFDAVRVALDEDRRFQLSVERPVETPDERLATLWSEVQQET
jgi:DNA-binding transcriptional ArsR family regulator